MDKSTVPIVDEIRSLIKETQENLKEASASHKREMKEIRDSHKKLSALSAEAKQEMKEIRDSHKKLSALSEEAKQEAKREMKEIRDSHKKLSALSEEAKREMEELRASQKATDRQIEATDRQIKKFSEETGYHIREMSREIKKAQNLFTTQWGRLVESLVEGDLVRLLREKGVEIERTSTNEKGLMSYVDENGVKQKEQCEIDIVAKNGREIVVVEVKTSLTVTDVRKFLDVLKRFTQLLPEYRNNKIYGAVAYLRTQDSSDIYSEKNGLFVIKATGSSASITNKKDFKPKVFS